MAEVKGKNMIRILHIVSDMRYGGIETFLMNVLRNIDLEKYDCSILTARDIVGDYDEEVSEMGVEMYRLKHISEVGINKFCNNFRKVLMENDFDVVHCHMNAWAGLFLPIAKDCDIKIRIAHSHSSHNSVKETGLLKTIYKNYLKTKIKGSATRYVACGEKAGKWLFGEKIASSKLQIVWNGINTNHFIYDESYRNELRENLGINEAEIVIGNVGNLRYAKNHLFLIEVFDEVYKENTNVKLLIVGEGEYRSKIEAEINRLNIERQVQLLGARDDVDKLLSVFDIFVMPSFYEGFPVTLVEAQTSGLPCIVSENITKEVNVVPGKVKFVALNSGAAQWKREIIQIMNAECKRTDGEKYVNEKGFSIEGSVRELCKIYDEA